MRRVSLGKTGLFVSKLCFGTLTLGPFQKNLPLSEGAALLEAAFARGVNFLDTAELYQTYPYVREALKTCPGYIVATKCYAYDAKGAQTSFRKAAQGIGREYIDVFLLHEQESEHTIRGHYEAIEYFLKKKEQGYIGAVGLSTHFIAAAKAIARYPELTVLHPLINLTGIGIADGAREDMERACSEAHAKGAGIYTMKSLGGGHLIERREEALSYAFALPFVSSVAVGMQSLAEVEYACAFASGEPVDDILPKLSTQERRLFIDTWCGGCGECVRACKGGALSVADEKALVDHTKCVRCGYCAARCPDFHIRVL